MNERKIIHRILGSNMPDSQKLEWLTDALDYESSIDDADNNVQERGPREKQHLNNHTQELKARRLKTAAEVSEAIGYARTNLTHWYQQRPDLIYREEVVTDHGAQYLYDLDSVLEFMRVTSRTPRPTTPRRRRHANITNVRQSSAFVSNGGSSKTHSNVEIRDWYNLSQMAQVLKVAPSSIEKIRHHLDLYQISDMKIANVRQVQATLRGEKIDVDLSVWRRWGLMRHIADVYNLSHQELGRARNNGELAYHYISKGRCVMCIQEVEQKYGQSS